jgi:tRNA U34 2-thiouridine synthase MnmA/TrmU
VEIDKLVYDNARVLSKVSASPEVFHQISEQLHPRSMIVIFSDLNEWWEKGKADDFFAALQHFRYNKHEVVVFGLVDSKTEIELKLPNRPTRFVDLETGEELRLNPIQVREQYSERAKAYYADIKLTCAQFEIDFVETDIRDDFRQVMVQYLIKRAKLM